MKSTVCDVGLVTAGVTCDWLMFHLVRKRLRAHSLPSTMMQQQLQPESARSTSLADRLALWAAGRLPQQVVQRLDQLPHKSLLLVLVAFIGLGVRFTGASRHRKQKPDGKKSGEEKVVTVKNTERNEPDAEPDDSMEVERGFQMFRIHTERQPEEEGLEQLNRERQVVPDGLVRSRVGGLERKLQQNPLSGESLG